MKTGVYSVFDRKAVSYGPLMFYSNHDIAKRGCQELMMSGDRSIPPVLYPDDFDMYCVGFFDTDSGELYPTSPGPSLVCRMSDFVEKK